MQPDAYRSRYADLAALPNDVLEGHWIRCGRAEGRIGNGIVSRQDFVRLALLRSSLDNILEIGPFCNPVLPGAVTCDVLSTEALRARAARVGQDPTAVVDVDYVVDPVEGIKGIGRLFDAVVSSHVLEHQPDLVAHLRSVRAALRSDGLYFLLVPDSRYCFDHFLPPSSVAQVVAAHHEGRLVHTLQSVIEHRALTTHNDATRHWAGDHGDVEIGQVHRVRQAMREYASSGGSYIDVHAWQFTPSSFGHIMPSLFELFEVGFSILRIYETHRDSNEFRAILQAV